MPLLRFERSSGNGVRADRTDRVRPTTDEGDAASLRPARRQLAAYLATHVPSQRKIGIGTLTRSRQFARRKRGSVPQAPLIISFSCQRDTLAGERPREDTIAFGLPKRPALRFCFNR